MVTGRVAIHRLSLGVWGKHGCREEADLKPVRIHTASRGACPSVVLSASDPGPAPAAGLGIELWGQGGVSQSSRVRLGDGAEGFVKQLGIGELLYSLTECHFVLGYFHVSLSGVREEGREFPSPFQFLGADLRCTERFVHLTGS